jgi:hypothetical protein
MCGPTDARQLDEEDHNVRIAAQPTNSTVGRAFGSPVFVFRPLLKCPLSPLPEETVHANRTTPCPRRDQLLPRGTGVFAQIAAGAFHGSDLASHPAQDCWDSLDLIANRRPDVHVFNELLVQYPLPRRKRPGQVVPDNMVVLYNGPIKAEGSYDVPLQPVAPFWVLEYVSKTNQRKVYDDNMLKYETQLKVPYYLLFHPEHQEVMLYHHNGAKYVTVQPNEAGRLPLPQLDLEMALVEGWVRFWYRGELVPLPAELQHLRDELQHQRDELQHQRDDARQQLQAAEAEAARLRAEVERLRQPPTEKG